jgi:methylthioribose-1-phosphate isomerase
MEAMIPTLSYAAGVLTAIDQRILPREERYMRLDTAEAVSDAIRTLAVRGAPAIGIAAAYGVAVEARRREPGADMETLRAVVSEAVGKLASSRPTAYNLFSCLDRVKKSVSGFFGSPAEYVAAIEATAFAIHAEDLDKSRRIAESGLPLLPANARAYSHCNAGGLATGGNGTSLSVLFAGHSAGRLSRVWVGETRPLLQGSRLTAWELAKRGIPYTVICDNMAASLMRKGEVDLVILGADRIARNGDFANKIGTYSLAVLAKHHGIPFYTAAPLTTFDPDAQSGADIPVEERDPSEVTGFAGTRVAPEGAVAWNPSFDVTPHELVTAIVTECGLIYPPFRGNIDRVLRDAEGGV